MANSSGKVNKKKPFIPDFKTEAIINRFYAFQDEDTLNSIEYLVEQRDNHIMKEDSQRGIQMPMPIAQRKNRKRMAIINEETENSKLFSMIKSRVTQKAAITTRSRNALKLPSKINKIDK